MRLFLYSALPHLLPDDLVDVLLGLRIEGLGLEVANFGVSGDYSMRVDLLFLSLLSEILLLCSGAFWSREFLFGVLEDHVVVVVVGDGGFSR